VLSHRLCNVVKFVVTVADQLRHTRSVAYSVKLVPLNKHQISGGGACLHCYELTVRTYEIYLSDYMYGTVLGSDRRSDCKALKN